MSECDGPGGAVYTLEGPQFGPQMMEEPCHKCGQWHRDNRPRPKPAPIERVDKYVVVFAVIGLGYFAVVIGVSLWNARPW